MKNIKLSFIALLFVTTGLLTPIFAQTGDADNDGIVDSEDVCPKIKGTKENKGCLKNAEPTQKNNDSLDFTVPPQIVAGRGWDKVVLGATRSQIEAVIGTPEKFYPGNMLLPDPSSHHFQKGIIVGYDGKTNLVKELSFIGNPAYLSAGDYAGTFQKFSGGPGKNIVWGATAAQIVESYGAPKSELTETRKGVAIATLIYDQIVFTLAADKLYYVAVAADNNRLLAGKSTKSEENKSLAAETVKQAARLEYKADNTIVAGRGSGKIVLGAARAEVEAILGKPENFQDTTAGMFQIYEANYFSKGMQIEYNPKTNVIESILFFGDTAKSPAFKKYKLFSGKTDKGIRWGASPAEVMQVYGKPIKESFRYNPDVKQDYEYITYPNVAFGFNYNRLTYISNNEIWGK